MHIATIHYNVDNHAILLTIIYILGVLYEKNLPLLAIYFVRPRPDGSKIGWEPIQ